MVKKQRVLDAGVFIEGGNLEGITPPAVAKETEVPPIVEIVAPNDTKLKAVMETAEKTGDLDVLSRADVEVLALALQIDGIVCTNDFAVQNVAKKLKLEVEGVSREISKEIKWCWYCPACGWKRARKGECERCGTETKRRPT
ncbi:MAG: hypothetical protein GOV00_04500 [Candidatus Altiarchaeota archaeon]|nr:hypothetical protein [Candidatus Altiarchaeota archaeon]